MSAAVATDVLAAGEKATACAFGVAVVIVNYRTAGLARDCVASLLPELNGIRSVSEGGGGVASPNSEDPAHDALAYVTGSVTGSVDHIFIVDNASGGEEAAKLEALRTAPEVTVLEAGQNLGFAGGNNWALDKIRRMGGAEFYLLLNPDTVVRAGAIEALMRFLEMHPEADFVGPRLEGLDGTVQQSAFGDMSPLSELVRGASIGPITRWLRHWAVYGEIRTEAHETAWLAGACVLMRGKALERAGLLDDGFFMYFEEVDFFRRARRAGLRAWYEPAARVVHLVGQSSGVKVAAGQKRLPDYWFESRRRYFRKHFGIMGMIAADVFWVAGYALDRLRRLFTGVSHAHTAKDEMRDLLRHSWRGLTQYF